MAERHSLRRIAAMLAAKVLLVGMILSFPAEGSAEEIVARFRLVPDLANAGACSQLDSVLERVHTLTRENGDLELTSAGGIEGRMTPMTSEVYRIAFELDGRRLDVVADLASSKKTLTVVQTDRRCRWIARAE
jgi:hypothetical protein